MIERPLLLRGPQVLAFREGRQTQDRRPCKDQGEGVVFEYVENASSSPEIWNGRETEPYTGFVVKYPDCPLWLPCDCPFGQEGDQLWIRETWGTPGNYDHVKPSDLPNHIGCEIVYRATEQYPLYYHWRPSIHMPRWASRLTLEIERVRVEQVQDIAPDDAIAEGYPFPRDEAFPYPVDWFLSLWNSIYAKTYPWAYNPWVWVMDLKVVDATPKS